MAENIVLWILFLSIAATFIFVYGIIEDEISKWLRKKEREKQLAAQSPPRPDSAPVNAAIQKDVARGFET